MQGLGFGVQGLGSRVCLGLGSRAYGLGFNDAGRGCESGLLGAVHFESGPLRAVHLPRHKWPTPRVLPTASVALLPSAAAE